MDPDTLGKIADAIGEVAKVISIPDEIKKAAFLPAATSIGERFGRFFKRNQLSNQADEIVETTYLQNLQMQSIKFFEEHPNASLDEAKTRLIHKQIDDSYYSIDNEYMRTRFAKLIANTADENTNDNISPYYSNILSNLNSKSASILLYVSENSYTPIMQIASDSSYYYMPRLDSGVIADDSKSLTQLSSLGLIELDLLHVSDNTELLENFAINSLNLNYSYYRLGKLVLTDLGNSFIKVIK